MGETGNDDGSTDTSSEWRPRVGRGRRGKGIIVSSDFKINKFYQEIL